MSTSPNVSIIEQAAGSDERMVKIAGPAASGKTEVLVKRCAALLDAGTAPESILIEACSSFAAQAFSKRLGQAAKDAEAASRVKIATPLDICSVVLAEPACQEHTGRSARILSGAEYKFFLEDMRPLGMPARRLKGMLSFFFKQWGALEPYDAWVVGDEEKTVYEYAKQLLEMRGGTLAQEAAWLAVEFLKSDAGASVRGRFSHVLADDFQNLDHAQQTCLCLLAGEQIVVAGNADETVAPRNTVAYPAGFDDFEKLRRNVKVFTLEGSFGNEAIASFCAELAGTEGGKVTGTGDPQEFAEGIHTIKWATPEDELDGLTKYLRSFADSQESFCEKRTCVVVPNRQWARLAERVLVQRGFTVSTAGASAGLGGDPRNAECCKALRAYTLLNLLADDTDMVAWRSWCGFGNHLTNSDAWKLLQEHAIEHGTSLAQGLDDALEAMSKGEELFLRANVLAKLWETGHELIKKHKDRKGYALLHAIGAEGLHEFELVEQVMQGDETATQLFALARESFDAPVLPVEEHVLHIATYRTLAGLSYDNVFVFACIDGFMPQRNAFEIVSTNEERTAVMEEERHAFYRTCSTASKRLVVSYFSKAELELAERSKMQVTRVRAEGDKRMALVRPSTFIEQAQAARPSTVGGQGLLASLGFE